jgi:hypothetical protein
VSDLPLDKMALPEAARESSQALRVAARALSMYDPN